MAFKHGNLILHNSGSMRLAMDEVWCNTHFLLYVQTRMIITLDTANLCVSNFKLISEKLSKLEKVLYNLEDIE